MYCIQQSPSRCVSLSVNGVQKCDGWNPNSCRSLVLSHSQDEVSAGPSNLSSLEVTAFDFYTAHRVSSSLSLSPLIVLCVTRMSKVQGYV